MRKLAYLAGAFVALGFLLIAGKLLVEAWSRRADSLRSSRVSMQRAVALELQASATQRRRIVQELDQLASQPDVRTSIQDIEVELKGELSGSGRERYLLLYVRRFTPAHVAYVVNSDYVLFADGRPTEILGGEERDFISTPTYKSDGVRHYTPPSVAERGSVFRVETHFGAGTELFVEYRNYDSRTGELELVRSNVWTVPGGPAGTQQGKKTGSP